MNLLLFSLLPKPQAVRLNVSEQGHNIHWKYKSSGTWQDLLQPVIASSHHDYKEAREGSSRRHWQILPATDVSHICGFPLSKQAQSSVTQEHFYFPYPTLVCRSLKPGKQLESKIGRICSPVFQEEHYFWGLFLARANSTNQGLCANPKISLIYMSFHMLMILQVGRSNTWEFFPWQNMLC